MRRDRGADGLTLLCFPHAGGSAAVYTHWARALPHTTVVPVELPGRGTRVDEPPADAMDAFISDLAGAVLPHVNGRFMLFGHDLGALIAFELANRLRWLHGVRPERLLVSGCAAPGISRLGAPLRHQLPDDELWPEVRLRNGALCGHEEVRRRYLAALRADFALAANYRFTGEAPLTCPISVFGGIDDPEVSLADLEAWSAHTTRRRTVSTFPGGHFYLHRNSRLFLHVLDLKVGVSGSIENLKRAAVP